MVLLGLVFVSCFVCVVLCWFGVYLPLIFGCLWVLMVFLFVVSFGVLFGSLDVVLLLLFAEVCLLVT